MNERLLARFFLTCSHFGEDKNKGNILGGMYHRKHFQQQQTVSNSAYLFRGKTLQLEECQRKTMKQMGLWEVTEVAQTQPQKTKLEKE